MSTQRVPNRDVNAAQRVAVAVRLRAQRLTYEEIAQRAGYGSASACRKAILRELNRVVVGSVDELRREEVAMLDRLHAVVWPLAVPMDAPEYDRIDREDRDDEDEEEEEKEPFVPPVDLNAVRSLLLIAERRAKLLGLDLGKDGSVAMQPIIIREVPAGLLSTVVDEVQP